MIGEGFVLAGGRGTRMGGKKWRLTYRGRSLLERAIEILAALRVEIRVVVGSEQDFKPLSVPILVDRVAGVGPLGGIYTALEAAHSPQNYFIACDTPLLPSRLFRILGRYAACFDAVVPRDHGGRVHSLCAIYSTACLPVIERHLELGQLGVQQLLRSAALNVKIVEASEHRLSDSLFLNINTPEDLQRLKMREP